jgi:hypothetical protein
MRTWGMKLRDVLKELDEFGFEQVLDIPFIDKDTVTQNHYYVYFYEKYGILLTFDTYGGDRVNGGLYYYQWSPHLHHPCFSSGGWINVDVIPTWIGNGDCREGMFESIRELARDGVFVTPWVQANFCCPSFVHYMDYHSDESWDKGYELYKKAADEQTAERFKILPENVQTAIINGMRFNRKE